MGWSQWIVQKEPVPRRFEAVELAIARVESPRYRVGRSRALLGRSSTRFYDPLLGKLDLGNWGLRMELMGTPGAGETMMNCPSSEQK